MNLQADLSEALGFLDELEAGLRGPALQKALNKASLPLQRAVKAQAKRRVSLYYSRSIALRKKAARAQGGDFIGGAWVGIGHINKTEEREVDGLWGTRHRRKVNYSKIAHLVEEGFHQAPIKKDARGRVITGFGKYVASEPIMKQVGEGATVRFERDFERELRYQIDQAQAKVARKAYAALDGRAQLALRKSVGGGGVRRR